MNIEQPKSRVEKGRALQEIMRPGMSEHLERRFTGSQKDFGSYTTEVLFGEFWNRDTLDLRSRELVVLSSLLSSGNLEDFKIHVGIAPNFGLTRQEITEVVYQLALYIGWPKTGEGMRIINEVLGAETNER